MIIEDDKPVGIKAIPHMVAIDYKTWGLANLSSDETEMVIETKEINRSELMKYIIKLEQIVDLKGYAIVNGKYVQHYCGETYDRLTVAWLRFERKDQVNKGVGGEHISATFDVNSDRLMGMVRMFADVDNNKFISHQHALEIAIKFLGIHASDLISREVMIPQLTKLDNGSRIEFDREDKRLKLDKIQVCWIGDHKELIYVNGQSREIHGMKVKMFVPEQKLYVWVVVDSAKSVLIFERNISWDFAKIQRNTQMWLQDSWLQANKINPNFE